MQCFCLFYSAIFTKLIVPILPELPIILVKFRLNPDISITLLHAAIGQAIKLEVQYEVKAANSRKVCYM